MNTRTAYHKYRNATNNYRRMRFEKNTNPEYKNMFESLLAGVVPQKTNNPIYRGLSQRGNKSASSIFRSRVQNPGNKYENNSFASFSNNMYKAKQFSGQTGIIMKLEPGIYNSVNKKYLNSEFEKETTLAPGTYTFVRRNNTNGTYVMKYTPLKKKSSNIKMNRNRNYALEIALMQYNQARNSNNNFKTSGNRTKHTSQYMKLLSEINRALKGNRGNGNRRTGNNSGAGNGNRRNGNRRTGNNSAAQAVSTLQNNNAARNAARQILKNKYLRNNSSLNSNARRTVLNMINGNATENQIKNFINSRLRSPRQNGNNSGAGTGNNSAAQAAAQAAAAANAAAANAAANKMIRNYLNTVANSTLRTNRNRILTAARNRRNNIQSIINKFKNRNARRRANPNNNKNNIIPGGFLN